MGTRIKIKNKHTIQELENFILSCTDKEQKKKVQAILQIRQGKTRADMARKYSVKANTVTDWIKRYNEKSLKGLETNKGGRPEGNPKWENAHFDALVKEINKQDKYWSLALMSEWLETTYKDTVPLSTVWYRMTQSGYSHKSSRPSPYLGDTKKQEEFKKKWAHGATSNTEKNTAKLRNP
jgi:transposase